MKIPLITTIIFFSIVLNGCNNNVTVLGDPQYMPKDWLKLSEKAWQFKKLPEASKLELHALKVKLIQAREGQYFSFYQKYNPELLSELDGVISNMNRAYLNLRYSNKAIIANLTPAMNGLSETYSENDAGIIVVNNANERMYVDDWRRALILDKPSALSPYPVVAD